MANKNMNRAKNTKNDEFYTRLTDIEKELLHYRDQFKNKTIYCNCDDPKESNFWMYFYLSFDFLSLKKLISTHYDKDKPTYKLEYNGKDVIKTNLQENGDFRSKESIELLKKSDIVVTNPPFSLYREYVSQLIDYDKKFLIIGNHGSMGYKEIFPLIKANKIWIGYSPRSMIFTTPENNNKSVNACWFTNLDVSKRHETLILYKKYNPENYPKYDNYDAIDVSKTNNIPKDYAGVMGVPISFMDKYNPDQFEIIGMTAFSKEITGLPILNGSNTKPSINDKDKYARILIKRK